MADVVQRMIEALVAVADGDATLRSLMGRIDGLLVPWTSPEDADLPLLVYAHVATIPIAGVGDTRTSQFQLTAWAEGQGAQALCHAILERCEEVFAPTDMLAAGIDAAPVTCTRRGALIDPEGSRVLTRADMDIEFHVTA